MFAPRDEKRAAFRAVLAAAAMLLAGWSAQAAEVRRGAITVSSQVVRASFAGSPNSAAYLVIANSGAKADQLVAARCACAASVGIHKTEDMGGMSMMTSAAPVVIPAHGQVIFHPGGLHLMLTGLKGRLADGGRQEITLVFQHAGAVRADFPISARIATVPAPPMAPMRR
jgi:hypothetical protein